jgi:predicted peptidase
VSARQSSFGAASRFARVRIPVALRLIALLLLLGACTSTEGFLDRSVAVNGHLYRYRVWLPPHYTKVRRWPVILFLHGSGERGDDNLSQLTVGLPLVLSGSPDRYPAVVVLPQCEADREWYGEMEQQALASLDASIDEFHGDRARVYLTGISMGGAGVWYFARHPQRWAALVPIAGEVVRQANDPFPQKPPPDLMKVLLTPDPFAELSRDIGRIPVWAFHSSDDAEVPVEQSRRMVAALTTANGNVRYTEYDGVGHDSWDQAYQDPRLPIWLMRQKKK